MQIILGEDTAPHRDGYQAGLGRALTAAWETAGHAVIRATRQRLIDADRSASETVSTAKVRSLLEQYADARVHLLTTGPVAHTLATECANLQRPFTSSCDPVSAATLDEPWFRNSIDTIHAKATRVIAPAAAAGDLLRQSGLPNVAVVRPGVDTATYQPRVYNYLVLPRPVTLLLGAPIDSLELRGFLEMPLPGSRAVYAPGWTGREIVNSVRIFGYLPPSELARLISAADACVIPGTGPETLLTSLQSLACGVPVAARQGRYVADLLVEADVGAADDDLARAVATAFGANRQVCRGLARRYSWAHAARRVLETGLQPDTRSYAERDVA